jgi:hypothetical protein
VAEVAFCGHATIALGVALGTGDSDEARYRLTTRSGGVGLHVAAAASGPVAALTSVEPSHARRHRRRWSQPRSSCSGGATTNSTISCDNDDWVMLWQRREDEALIAYIGPL